MTRADVEELLERTAIARGLPRHIEDPSVLARVAAIVRREPESERRVPKRRRRGEAA